ncbi:hypothetical protein GWI33_017195 [Rhynchophorus ferrugineus]|uniref:Uncharacterized protein n=1 Tax=Rhynchophorus ferrugineus TaxID=354439 RepID=A0A834M9C9_RHYFE|nr:hypothetical protein GWI33_017195 [Rhynchophorus ferrugineus]
MWYYRNGVIEKSGCYPKELHYKGAPVQDFHGLILVHEYILVIAFANELFVGNSNLDVSSDPMIVKMVYIFQFLAERFRALRIKLLIPKRISSEYIPTFIHDKIEKLIIGNNRRPKDSLQGPVSIMGCILRKSKMKNRMCDILNFGESSNSFSKMSNFK